MKILYFASIRQRAGKAQDDVEVPANVTDVEGLIHFLSERDEALALALSDRRRLRVALNQKHSTLNASLVGVTEVAFFPPVTGG